jgi:hypothetical protein
VIKHILIWNMNLILFKKVVFIKKIVLNKAEEYNGSHLDKIYTDDKRFMNELQPFFNTYLKFEFPMLLLHEFQPLFQTAD